MDLVIGNINNTYAGGARALADVSLTIPAGMYGLLGPSGQPLMSLLKALRGNIS